MCKFIRQVQEQKLANFMETSAKRILEHVVQNIHLKFFEIAPAGQEFFKESKTRMYLGFTSSEKKQLSSNDSLSSIRGQCYHLIVSKGFKESQIFR